METRNLSRLQEMFTPTKSVVTKNHPPSTTTGKYIEYVPRRPWAIYVTALSLVTGLVGYGLGFWSTVPAGLSPVSGLPSSLPPPQPVPATPPVDAYPQEPPRVTCVPDRITIDVPMVDDALRVMINGLPYDKSVQWGHQGTFPFLANPMFGNGRPGSGLIDATPGFPKSGTHDLRLQAVNRGCCRAGVEAVVYKNTKPIHVISHPWGPSNGAGTFYDEVIRVDVITCK